MANSDWSPAVEMGRLEARVAIMQMQIDDAEKQIETLKAAVANLECIVFRGFGIPYEENDNDR